jgi:hypothetical protein
MDAPVADLIARQPQFADCHRPGHRLAAIGRRVGQPGDGLRRADAQLRDYATCDHRPLP